MINPRHYLRFLSKHKTLTLINVLGLTTGITTCIFIALYISHELSYDRHHKNFNRIFTVTTKLTTNESLDHLGVASMALAPELKNNYPEVEEAVRFNRILDATVRYQNNLFREKDMLEADNEIFNVFTYNFLQGNPSTALSQPLSVVVTKSFASKYFGKDDALNKTLLIKNKEYLVTGVLEDLPPNSDLTFSALIAIDKSHDTDWLWDFSYTFILFNEEYLNIDPQARSFGEKLKKLSEEKLNEEFLSSNQSTRMTMFVEPLKGMHFREPLYGDTPKGNLKFIYIIGSVAMLMLCIGSLNFINFSLVQSLERSKEVGIRKVIGARKVQLVSRYLAESLFITLFAFVVALLICPVLIPLFNDITGNAFQAKDLLDITFIVPGLLGVLFVGIFAGSYPAFFTSSIKPVESLKGKVSTVRGMSFRKISITAQFAIAIGLIICTVLTFRQMEFISNYDLGFRKDNIVVIDTPADSVYAPKLKVFKESLLGHKHIQMVSNVGYGALPGEIPNKVNARTKVDGDAKIVNFSFIDEDYLSTLDMQLVEGRSFDGSRVSDKNAVIVNEAFAKVWGWDKPLEEKMQWGGEASVIGVIKDFHFLSLHNRVEPHLFVMNNQHITNTLVRFDYALPVAKQLELLKSEWSALFSDQPFVYRFLDESLAAQYIREEKAVTLFTIFSTLTVIVACLGLFGLCSLTISQRKKEVGIRKIIGASFGSIVSLFSKEYLLLICISFVMITPVSFFLVDRWLETFPLKEDISIAVFLATGVGVICLGLVTIVISITKTLKKNPADLIKE